MTQEVVERVIAKYGGATWLKNMVPETLFRFLKVEDGGRTETIMVEIDGESGWMIFVDKSISKQRRVLAVFYEKGKCPSFYPGRLKYDVSVGLILVHELSEFFDPRVADFGKKVFNLFL